MRRHFNQAILVIFLLVLPLNLFFKFLTDQAYVNGRLVDYLIPKLYAVDVVGLVLVISLISHRGMWGKTVARLKQINSRQPIFKWVGITTALLALLQLTTSHPIVGLFWLSRWVGYLLLGFLIQQNLDKFRKSLSWGIDLSFIFQFFLAGYQFLMQKPLLPYQYLGETRIAGAIDIARHTFIDGEKVLAYGATAHPNILAGTLTFFWLWQLGLSQQWSRRWRLPILAFGFLATLIIIYLTQSFSALVALITALLIYQQQLKVKRQQLTNRQLALSLLGILLFIPVLIHLATNYWPTPSFTRRDQLNLAGLRLIIARPLWGAGVSQVTSQIEFYESTAEKVRFVQPPHHALILWLAESGTIGVIILILVIVITIENDPKSTRSKQLAYLWVYLAALASLDHYLLTSATGMMLLSFTVIGLGWKWEKFRQ